MCTVFGQYSPYTYRIFFYLYLGGIISGDGTVCIRIYQLLLTHGDRVASSFNHRRVEKMGKL
jgi:hypothetical protein